MKRVLIIKTGAIGDLVMSTPMLSALHASHPGIEVIWLVEKANADLLRGIRQIHRVIPFDSNGWHRDWRKARLLPWLRATRALRRELLADGPIDAIICAHAEESRWWPILPLSRVRVGLHPGEALPARKQRRFTATFGRPASRSLHNIDHYLTATRALGCPDASLGTFVGQADDEQDFVTKFKADHDIDSSRPIVLVAPFTTWPTKSWEMTRWVELIDWLVERFDAQVVMTMARGDEIAATAFQDAMSTYTRMSFVLAKETTLRQFVALIRCSGLVVSVDSSALHIAAAVGTPYIALFGPTKTEEIAPPVAGTGQILRHALPCSPCGKPNCVNPIERECMKKILVSEVQAQVTRLLSR